MFGPGALPWVVSLATLVFAAPLIAQSTPRERCGFPDRAARQGSLFATQPSDCGYFSTTILPEYDSGPTYDIPVVFHVIQNTSGAGFLSLATIQDQIDVLNEDFQALAGSPGAQGIDAKVRFHLAKQDPAGSPSTGVTYATNNNWYQDSGSYWNTLAWDTNRYLNVYTNAVPCCFGYVPDWPQGGIVGQKQDRVVVWWEAVGKQPTSGWPLNMGRTLTHEVGHYFGLEHPFYGGCASAASCYTNGDLICDTNPQSNPTSGCPGSKSSCTSPDAIHNYMDYSDDHCLTEFTPEQRNRMRCTIQHWRKNLPIQCNVMYGQGCAGTGGVSPTLFVDGCAAPSAQVEISIGGGLGGGQAFLFLGLGPAALPMGGGCTLNVSPLLPVIVGPLPLGGAGAGAGGVQFGATIPASAMPGSLSVQAFVVDAGGPLGFSNTPGVTMAIL